MSILWTIIIGFIAGVIAKLIMPGDNEPSGFILTTILGIVGAFVASYLGEAHGLIVSIKAAAIVPPFPAMRSRPSDRWARHPSGATSSRPYWLVPG